MKTYKLTLTVNITEEGQKYIDELKEDILTGKFHKDMESECVMVKEVKATLEEIKNER